MKDSLIPFLLLLLFCFIPNQELWDHLLVRFLGALPFSHYSGSYSLIHMTILTEDGAEKNGGEWLSNKEQKKKKAGIKNNRKTQVSRNKEQHKLETNNNRK